jgi:hypothetical protein
MSRWGPLATLGSVVVLAGIFLWANTLVAKPGAPAAHVQAAPVVSHALYLGRSSGNEVTVAIAINGRKAAADLDPGLSTEVLLQGSVSGSQVTLTGRDGASLTGTMSGLAMFGTVTPSAGLSFPFSAELSPRPAGVYQARITVNGLATRIGWAVLPDGTQLGVAVAGGARHPAPPLNLGNDGFTLGGASFRAAPVVGDATVVSP